MFRMVVLVLVALFCPFFFLFCTPFACIADKFVVFLDFSHNSAVFCRFFVFVDHAALPLVSSVCLSNLQQNTTTIWPIILCMCGYKPWYNKRASKDGWIRRGMDSSLKERKKSGVLAPYFVLASILPFASWLKFSTSVCLCVCLSK